MNYCKESIDFINKAYRLLDIAKHHPEKFKPHRCRSLIDPYCLVLSKKDDWKLSLCTSHTADGVTYEKVYTLDDNRNVPELLWVYIGYLEQMEEDSKSNEFDILESE